jgi:DNA-binding response OmpR family regulator
VARLLVVDDDPLYTGRLAQALLGRGHVVWQAASGAQALALAQAHPPEVALLDLRLPDISGHALAAALRAQNDCAILIVSTVGQEADVVGSFAAGADDHLVKPFMLDELEARIVALLRRRPAAPAPHPCPYADDYLFYDPIRRVVETGGRRVVLSPIEYTLFALLVAHRGEPVPKEALIRAAWPEATGIHEQYLAAYIASLRGKLERDARHPAYLLTCRGVGYMFRERAA